MKRILATLFVIITLVTATFAASRNNDFRPDKVTHNFGTVEELGGKVSHTFVYTNHGKKAVAIVNATTHCDCAKATYSTQPVRPGGKTKITVTFNPEGHPGMFSKAVQIRLTDGTYATVCRIAGKVAEAKRTIAQRFPYDLGNGMRVDLQTLDFSGATLGSKSSLFVRLINTGKQPLNIQFSSSPNIGNVEVPATCYLRPGAETLMAVSFIPSAQTAKLHTASIQPKVNGKNLKCITLMLPRKRR